MKKLCAFLISVMLLMSFISFTGCSTKEPINEDETAKLFETTYDNTVKNLKGVTTKLEKFLFFPNEIFTDYNGGKVSKVYCDFNQKFWYDLEEKFVYNKVYNPLTETETCTKTALSETDTFVKTLTTYNVPNLTMSAYQNTMKEIYSDSFVFNDKSISYAKTDAGIKVTITVNMKKNESTSYSFEYYFKISQNRFTSYSITYNLSNHIQGSLASTINVEYKYDNGVVPAFPTVD